jgi:probable rRNA maturation factor
MFELTNTTKTTSRVPFQKIAHAILGIHYNLSVALVGDTRARTINRERKGKDYPTNVLSFPLSKTDGEIILNPHRASRDAAAFGHTPRQHLTFLFIHACLHLQGHTHGHTMEKLEKKFLSQFI